MYLIINSNNKPGPPFSRVPDNVVSNRTSPPGPPVSLLRSLDLIPPIVLIRQTCPSNNFVPTEPFPTILTALDSLREYLSNDILYVRIRPGEVEKERVNKEIGNSRFSSPRADMKIRMTPLESYELKEFSEVSQIPSWLYQKIPLIRTIPTGASDFSYLLCGTRNGVGRLLVFKATAHYTLN